MQVVGVDLGGTHVAAAVMDVQGKLLGRAEEFINRHEVPKVTLQRDVAGAIRNAVHQAGLELKQISTVGMGLPGNIDRARGICRYSPNFRWHDVPVAQFLEESLDMPVHLLNDVRSHTLGELHFGAGKDLNSFAMLALGTGIGGGVVLDRRLREGAHSAGGEVGHITVDPNGPLCGCGNHGCIEALAAAPAIGRAGQEAAAKGEAPGLIRVAGSIDAITAATVAEAAEHGDPAARAIWEKVGRWLGLAICAIIGTLDPEKILVGGKV
ncbi:MAG TPA: ROK family protein, partial [Candidatus Xenobia bacterium]